MFGAASTIKDGRLLKEKLTKIGAKESRWTDHDDPIARR
jgi:hypothetical protein